jgi:hypothetical protein
LDTICHPLPFLVRVLVHHPAFSGICHVPYYINFFFFTSFWNFHNFLLCHLSQRSACSQVPSQVATPPEDWQSAEGWGDAGFESGTVGQQSDVLPLSHHVFPKSHHAFPRSHHAFPKSYYGYLQSATLYLFSMHSLPHYIVMVVNSTPYATIYF